jgi:hypothetical protein
MRFCGSCRLCRSSRRRTSPRSCSRWCGRSRSSACSQTRSSAAEILRYSPSTTTTAEMCSARGTQRAPRAAATAVRCRR